MRLKFFFKPFFIFDNGHIREKWIQEQLKDLPSGSELLDAGCGQQIYRKYCSHLNYKAQDFGEYIPDKAQGGLHTEEWIYGELDYKCNVWQIPEKSETFDTILCTEVFEHLPYPQDTLKELMRLLKPNGKLILTAPFSSIPHMNPYYYFSGFSQDFYFFFGNQYGFTIRKMIPNGDAYSYTAQELNPAVNSIPNLFLKWIIKIPMHLMLIPILKAFSKLYKNNASYLPFGYHLILQKNG